MGMKREGEREREGERWEGEEGGRKDSSCEVLRNYT